MSAVLGGLRSFGHFWYSFVIGDDWIGAAGVVALVAGAYGLRALGIPFWWWGPVVVPATAVVTVVRALRRRVRAAPG